MEYGAIVWVPYTTVDTNKLERIQRRAARFITGGYKSREEGSVTKMLAELELESLQSRRTSQRLILLYKVVEGLVPAIKPEDYLTKSRQRRTIKPKRFDLLGVVSNFCWTWLSPHSSINKTVSSWVYESPLAAIVLIIINILNNARVFFAPSMRIWSFTLFNSIAIDLVHLHWTLDRCK